MIKGTAEFIERACAYQGNECVLWPFSVDGRGYPCRKGWEKVHRLVCTRAHGEPPTTQHEAAHSCGVRRCINPHHLRWATRSENQMDRIGHGTGKRGAKHHNTKLTEADVLQIRASGKSGAFLAKRYNISQQNVCNIRKRRSWAWL